jgi:holo-[acyl-carrier protein] synthase
MIIAIGVDIIEIERIKEALLRLGDRFRNRIFTQAEIRYCESLSAPYPSYAARFAAKEAAMKALGTGWRGGVRWRDIEVIRERGQAPSIQLSGRALEHFHQIGARRAHLSLSHSRDLAIAQVLFEA